MKMRMTFAAMGMMLNAVYAQETPVGLWCTIDDHSGQPRAEIRIVESGGLLSGKIEKQLDKDAKPDDKCDKCHDDRKGQPIKGLEIIRKVRKLDGEAAWGDGEILDPDNGKTYRVKLMPSEGGKKLLVRGYIGPFYRTQTWLRAE
jgi:uncharacterized protein (DUF2147 family)